RGLLKRFYDEYTAKENYARDRSAIDSFQVVFGKPIEEVERDWKAWLLEQTVPPVPFLGVQTKDEEGRVEVTKVVGKSPAGKAGIKKGDVIKALAGRPVTSQGALLEAVATRQVGEEVEVELGRGDETLTVTAKLGKRRGLVRRSRRPAPYLGLTVEQRDDVVVVREVAPDSPAHKAGLQPGDVIVEFAGKPQESVRGFLAALRRKKARQEVSLKVQHGDESRNVKVKLAPQPGAE
ncbi:MAG: PDZ domain-containing protein, partial [Planctomycetota bacterium]